MAELNDLPIGVDTDVPVEEVLRVLQVEGLEFTEVLPVLALLHEVAEAVDPETVGGVTEEFSRVHAPADHHGDKLRPAYLVAQSQQACLGEAVQLLVEFLEG